MNILGIETSCDETALAIYSEENGLVANSVHSQVDLFKEYGEVSSARVITDRFTKRSIVFGFVEMESGAEDAIQALNDSEVEGRKLVVNESKPREER